MAAKPGLSALADKAAELEKANDKAIASVMGPGAIQALVDQAVSDEFIAALPVGSKKKPMGAKEMQRTFIEACMSKLVGPALDAAIGMSKATVRDTRIAIIEEASKTSAASASCKAAQKQLKTMLSEAVQHVKDMNNATEQIVRIDTAVRGLRSKFAGKRMPDKVQSQLRSQHTLRESADRAYKDAEQAIFCMFDKRLGGSKSATRSTTTLKLPDSWDDVKLEEIIEPIRQYLLSDISEFWLMLIYLEAIEKCYDEDTGMFYKPPSLSSDYAETPLELRDFHRQQSNQLYHVLEQALGASRTKAMLAQTYVGRHSDVSIKGVKFDGMTLVWVLVQRYSKGEEFETDDLEAEFLAAKDHFVAGRPLNKVRYLSKFLEEAVRQDLPIRSSQFIIPIVDILSQRHGKFQTGLAKWEKGGSDRNNCTPEIESFFADIERITKQIERLDKDGENRWGKHTEANAVRVHKSKTTLRAHQAKPWERPSIKGGGKGGDKGGGKGGGKGGDKGAGTGGNPLKRKRCEAKDCKEDASKNQRFCLRCWRDGMEKNKIVTFKGEVVKPDELAVKHEKNKANRERKKAMKVAKLRAANAEKEDDMKDMKAQIKALQRALHARKEAVMDDDDGDGGDNIGGHNVTLESAHVFTRPTKVAKITKTVGDDGKLQQLKTVRKKLKDARERAVVTWADVAQGKHKSANSANAANKHSEATAEEELEDDDDDWQYEEEDES